MAFSGLAFILESYRTLSAYIPLLGSFPAEVRVANDGFRIERDSLGELKVPADALWGAQTQRAIENFPISGLKMPRDFIRALGLIKWAAATTNHELDAIDAKRAAGIQKAALEVADGRHDAQFPIDVFQTGSGTSSNMNANEVIARLASQYAGLPVHPNDHVNMSQSSNDVIPTAIHLSALLAVEHHLLPALAYLGAVISRRIAEVGEVVKTGRTHLMDAMPVTLGQEMSGWRTQIDHGSARIMEARARLQFVALGGTAVGTGVNAHPRFAQRATRYLSVKSGLELRPNANYFEAMSSQDTAVELSGSAPHAGRLADEDLERSASDEQRPAGRAGRDRAACAPTWQQHHAGQGEPGDSRGRDDGGRAGDG
jgi:fumarate hydratase class II